MGKDHYNNIGKSVSQSHRWVKMITVILRNQSQKSRIGKDHYGDMQEVDNNYVYITTPVYTMS